MLKVPIGSRELRILIETVKLTEEAKPYSWFFLEGTMRTRPHKHGTVGFS